MRRRPRQDTAVAKTDFASFRAAAAPRRSRRALLWGALVLLLVIAQTLLVGLTLRYESLRAQEATDDVAAEVAAEVRRELLSATQSLQAASWSAHEPETWRSSAGALMQGRREVLRVERRSSPGTVVEAIDTLFGAPMFAVLPRTVSDSQTELACVAARRAVVPQFSQTYYMPQPGGRGLELIDLCVPVLTSDSGAGFLVGSFSLAALLEGALTSAQARGYEISFVEGDGTRLARAGLPRGAGVFRAERPLDLPGNVLHLRTDSAARQPQLIPNLATALVMGLSAALFGLVLLLARDVRRRADAESALAEALAFRKAMEDSLITGLRARDMEGAITYVNPAFCAMVGFSADQLFDAASPPYWPPEHVDHYRERQRLRLTGPGARTAPEGFETVFLRSNGERFPVMVYEAPLVDGQGRHSGWMSAVLDLSAQRRVEELSRQQQERLQATARLATVGEMASLLSHELNQPLSAIASYASGSLNLLDDAGAPAPHVAGRPRSADADAPAPAPADADADADAELRTLLRQALGRIAEQAERAGRVIKSVHDFVRRREQMHETLRADQLIESVLPLVRLQARKCGTRIEIDLPDPVPRLRCDRTMLEQVLLNLTRNAIQAMESETPLEQRLLSLRVRPTAQRGVCFSVTDAGPGIAPEVAERLFTPFYTTRREGMGLGLSLCRTVIEQHGGRLEYSSPPQSGGCGTEFRFTLAASDVPAAGDHVTGPDTGPTAGLTADPTTVATP